jgi:hypothetical protein
LATVPKFSLIRLALLTATLSLCLAGLSRALRAQDQTAAPAPAKTDAEIRSEEAFSRVCFECHDQQKMGDVRRSKAQWKMLIDDMISRGAYGSEEDFDLVLKYLLRHQGSVNVNSAPADEISMVLGLSAAEADAIVSLRTRVGKLADLTTLKQVADPKKIDAARSAIRF